MGYRIGVDVGGTFTDLIAVTPDGEVVLDKTPSTLDDQSSGVMTGLEQLAARVGCTLGELLAETDVVVHGTTTGDNTMIEMDGAPTGLLTTEGHRDEIEMRRVHKEQIWDPAYPAPTPIARRRARIPVPERVAHDGEVLLPLDEDAVRAGVRRLDALGVRSVAIMFLFSFVRPEHERRAAEIVREEMPHVEHVSLSHEVMPRGPEFERVSTTLVNAYVAPRISAYVEHLRDRLRRAGYGGRLLIMQATGGVMPPEAVGRKAVSLLGSGPTGGVMGAALAANRAGRPDFVAVDMGGTSFDVCLVRGGRPEVKTDWSWRYRYYVGLPMVDVQSVGAGGGSIARVRQGTLLVGPESAGSSPGPVCYGRGGHEPTVTDADAVLGYLPATGFAGGRMQLDVDTARAALQEHVAAPLGVDLETAAWGVERIVNTNMANATRRVLAGYGTDPRDLAVIAYGGNGAVHAAAIADELGIDTVLVPRSAPAFSALGVLVADHVVDVQRSYVVPLSRVDLARVQGLLGELQDEVGKDLALAGLTLEDVEVTWTVGMAYAGQNFDLPVPLPEGRGVSDTNLLDLAERFHDRHEADRGFAFRNQEPVVRNLRLAVRGETPKPERLAPVAPHAPDQDGAAGGRPGSRPVFWGPEAGGWLDTPVHQGRHVAVDSSLDGPALVEEPFTVVVVPPAWTAELPDDTSYRLTRR